MRTILILLVFLSCTVGRAQDDSIPQEALDEALLTQQNDSITLEQILQMEKGNYVFIDIWSSWCGNCYIKLSEVKKLQKMRPDVSFIFLSVEGSFIKWKQVLEKLTLEGQHYFVSSFLHGEFAKAIGLREIPRYILFDPSGKLLSLDASNLSINQLNALLYEN